MSTLAEITGGCPKKMGCHWLIQAIHSAMLRGEVSDSRTRHGDCSFHSQKYRCLMVIQWMIHGNRMGYTIRLLKPLEAIYVNLIETPEEWRFNARKEHHTVVRQHPANKSRVFPVPQSLHRTRENSRAIDQTRETNASTEQKSDLCPIMMTCWCWFQMYRKMHFYPKSLFFENKETHETEKLCACFVLQSAIKTVAICVSLRTRTPHLNLSNNQQCIGSCWLQTFYLIWRTRW
jgi:hypothetical protein